ncbi:MAG: 30S ribosomal protein S18 [Candidatus Dojkabacteria bacterium]|nr:30S ribosomal protein S18 [Candidatus Dojkabacteria bacterium]MDQ7021707.1 30S ribosomal protein S18 [Candidatus Dojkabacteria bacterium]
MAKKKTHKRFIRKRIESCPLKGKEDKITYKNVHLLKKYITTRGRILPTSRTGICPKNQKKLTIAIKRARQLAFLPYTQYV